LETNLLSTLRTPEQKAAAKSLLALTELINQAVGDAISDLLAVEAVLACKGWTLEDWDAMYDDVPNRQEKVKVKDRYAFKTTNAEQTLTAPDGLQARIDAEVAKYSNGRCFVRPSGTEDIVRVYAEADTRENTDKLAWTVGATVFDNYGGTGDRPQHFPIL
jgi:phosphoacetylglucosamine mutase